MVEDMGVYKIPCEVNGLKVKMVFDTGAAAVSLSTSLAEMMMDNGYLTKEDITGQAKSMTADGRIIDHTNIVLRTVKIGGISLSNIHAVVLDNQTAPLLFGQSAIQQLGEISIKGDKLYIKGAPGSSPNSSTDNLFERWDSQNCTYSNYTYGFGWNLPKEYKWEKVNGQEKHTVFRVQGAPFVVFVNAQVSHSNGKDLWSVYDKYTAMVEELDAAIEKATGKLMYERTFDKCKLFGQNAIKTTYKGYYKDSRYIEPIETYTEEYIFIWGGYTLIAAVKIPKAIYDEYDCTEAISEIFKGFRITVKH